MTHSDESVSREIVATVHGKQIAACSDHDSLWVEISGPKGGNPWRMAPCVADHLARAVAVASDKAAGRPVRDA